MEHGVTWLNFLPGYRQIDEYIRTVQPDGGFLGVPVVFQHVAAAILVTIILYLIALRARSQLNRANDNGLVPEPDISTRNFLELIFEALYKQTQSMIGKKEAGRYFPVLAALSMFIFFSNILGLVPGFSPPTDNWNTTFACGFFVFIYYNFHGLRVNGWAHIEHLAFPAGRNLLGWILFPLLFPIEIVSHCARPFSLGVRLATNMIGDHAVLFAFLGLVPILVPLPFLGLGLMVCMIQTLVFVLLSIIYIALAVEEAHHDDHHDEEHGHAAGAHA